MSTIKYLSDNLIRIRGPVNVETNAAISSVTSCSTSLYDDRKDTLTRGGFGIGVDEWPVYDASQFVPNIDVAIVQRSDGTLHNGGLVTATDLTAGANKITVTTALTGTNVRTKSRVMCQLGAVIDTSTAYGTPVVGTYDWGFKGVIQSDHDDLFPGLSVRLETTLNASGVVLTEIWRATVRGGT